MHFHHSIFLEYQTNIDNKLPDIQEKQIWSFLYLATRTQTTTVKYPARGAGFRKLPVMSKELFKEGKRCIFCAIAYRLWTHPLTTNSPKISLALSGVYRRTNIYSPMLSRKRNHPHMVGTTGTIQRLWTQYRQQPKKKNKSANRTVVLFLIHIIWKAI